MYLKNKTLMTCMIFIMTCSIAKAQFRTAADFGFTGDGVTDISTALNTAINNPDVQTIWFSNKTNSGPALFLIDSTVSVPAGKVLKFEAGNRLTGHGTVNGGIIDASMQSWIFGDSLHVYPAATAHGWFSVKWYGAGRPGSTDSWWSIQHSINTCIRQGLERLNIPEGVFHISQPLILKTQSGNPFCTLDISGETTVWSGSSQIIADFDSTFAIGIHLGKGCKIRNLFIQGRFVPPNRNDDPYGWSSMPYWNFKGATDHTRDSQFSPYAGIVIDPFQPNGLPSDGGYPGLGDFYGYNPGNTGGSTATTIEDVTVVNFVVGICSSPNGATYNAECTKINRVRIENVKLCVSAGQEQEKMNVIDNLTCWGGTHTIFASDIYGKQGNNSGNWTITNLNLAAGVIRLIYNTQGGWFPIHISNVYAEDLGNFGTMNCYNSAGISNGSQVSNSVFDFTFASLAGNRVLATTDMGVTFKNDIFRMYDNAYTMMLFNSWSTFQDCKFSGVPVQLIQLSSPGVARTLYQNCTANNYVFGFNTIRTDLKSLKKGDGWPGANDRSIYLYNNNVTLTDQGAITSRYLTEQYTIAGKDVFVNFLESTSPKTGLVISSAHSTSFAANTDYYKVGSLVAFSPNPINESYAAPTGFGVVQSLSGGMVTVNQITATLADGDYRVTCLYPAIHKGSFMGDITGPNTISRIAKDFGDNPVDYTGFLIKTPYNNSTNGWVKILSYDSASNSFTTLGNDGSIFPVNVRDTALYFNNDATKKIETNSVSNQTVATCNIPLIFYKGMEIVEMAKSDKAVHYTVCKTGYNSHGAPSGETRIAQLCPGDSGQYWRTTGNNIVNHQNIFGTLTDDSIRIQTHAIDRGVITKAGLFGWGTNAPTKLWDVNGEARVRTLPSRMIGDSIVFAGGGGNLRSLSTTGNPMEYLSGLGTWQLLPTAGTGTVTAADEGVTLNGSTVLLGDYCARGGGAFKSYREINMANNYLYFNSDKEGKIYMGVTSHNDGCMPLHTRLEISTIGLSKAVNDYNSPDPSTSGLRFTDLTSKNEPIPNKKNGVLSLDEDGDVIWVSACCNKGKEDSEIMQRLTKLEDELKAVKADNLNLKNMLTKKLKTNRMISIGAAILSVLLSGHGMSSIGK